VSDQSAIEWTDATWNPVRGCTKVSPGCAHCYAETFAERFRDVKGHPYEQGFDLRLVPEKLDEPLRWKKPRRVFVNSMSDLFQDGVPDAYIDQVFAAMALAPQHTFQVLTKRADRLRAYLSSDGRHDAIVRSMDMPPWMPPGSRFPRVPENWPMPNVWLGVSVENQHFADERIPLLLQTPAAVRFISAEPLLEAVDLKRHLPKSMFHCRNCGRELMRDRCDRCGTFDNTATNEIIGLDWVIVGGESGHGARAFDIAWARSIVAQCKAAGVPVFVKQLGTNPHAQVSAAVAVSRPVIPMVLRDRKGGDVAEWPEDLRVREFPRDGILTMTT
jgi:protein gp37